MESALNQLSRGVDHRAFTLHANAPDRPELIVVDRTYGLIAVDIDTSNDGLTSRDGHTLLNRKVAELSQSIPVLESLRIHRMVISCRPSGDERDTCEMFVWSRPERIGREIDVVLIDEAQDFFPEWIELMLSMVRPGRGGATPAGDDVQAIYRTSAGCLVLTGHRVDHLRLSRSYRSTRPILAAAAALNSRVGASEDDGGLDGEPVYLIWAQSWADQAAAITWDVRRLLDSGERSRRDIGILITQKRGTPGALRRPLDSMAVPYSIINRIEARHFDPDSPDVKAMTAHAARGQEFSMVLLFGLEALSAVDDGALMITHTRDNVFLERLRDNAAVRRWTWSDDYEV